MIKRERKPKYFHPSKKTFSLLSWRAYCEHFCSLCSKRFYVSLVLTWEEQCGEHAGRRVIQTTTDPAFTVLWAQCAYSIVSLWPRCSALTANFTRNKKHILYSTNLYAYFTIYFYYHFNKYKTTLWFKRKQWVLKRH